MTEIQHSPFLSNVSKPPSQERRLTRVINKVILSAYLSLFLIFFPLVSQASNEEQTLKAAIIYKLPKFVQWPENTFHNSSQSFHICLIGDDSLKSPLNKLKQRKINNRSVSIFHIKYTEIESSTCHLIYINKTETSHLKSVIDSMKNKPILTISDMKFFAANGGNIEIYRKNKRFAFRINHQAAKDSNLILASPLLQMSKVIKR